MPKIIFDFEGWVTTNIEEVYSFDLEKDIDVTDWSSEKLAAALNNGKVCFSFTEAIINSEDVTINPTEYQSVE